MQSQTNLKEILAKSPEEMTKEELTAIIKSIHTQNLGKSHPEHETDPEAMMAGLLVVREAGCDELDDEYLPTCCRIGNPHRHSV